MARLKPERASGDTLAAGAWAAVALTPVGWFYGALTALAVYAARAGHRSGKVAVIVSGLLLVATIVVTLLYGGWVGLAVAAVVAVLVLAWVRFRRIAVVVSGLLLLAILLFSAWLYGGWVNVAGISVLAVAAVLVFAWARSRHKPPPGPDGAQRDEGTPAGTAPPGLSGRTS